MQILRVASSLHPEKPGGVGLHVDQMSSMQSSMGHSVTILTSDNGDRSLSKHERRDGYKIIRHREIVRPSGNSIIPGITNSLRKLAPQHDVIHAHSHLYFSSNVAAAFSKVNGTPIAITNHGLFSQTAPKLVQKAFIPTIARLTLNAAEQVFCYTDLAKQELRERGVSSPVAVIPNGIDCEMFKPNPKVETQDQLLFVGRLERGKGPSYLIDAFNSIVDSHPQYSLKIVGYGSLEDDLKKQCEEYDISDAVTFSGELSYAEMPRVYNESSILASPTLTEAAVPRVAMEAWACETPVVMSNIQEVSAEHVGDAGSLVPLRDADALAEAIEELIEDGECRVEAGKKGRQRVLENHSWQHTVKQTTVTLEAISNQQ